MGTPKLSSRIRINRAFQSIRQQNSVTRELYKSNPQILADIMQRKKIYKQATDNSTKKHYYDYCTKMNKTVDTPSAKPEIGFYNLKEHFDQDKTPTAKRLKIDMKETNNSSLDKLIRRRDPSTGQKRPLNDFNHQEKGLEICYSFEQNNNLKVF